MGWQRYVRKKVQLSDYFLDLHNYTALTILSILNKTILSQGTRVDIYSKCLITFHATIVNIEHINYDATQCRFESESITKGTDQQNKLIVLFGWKEELTYVREKKNEDDL